MRSCDPFYLEYGIMRVKREGEEKMDACLKSAAMKVKGCERKG